MLRTIRNYAAGALLGGFTLVLPIVLFAREANWFWVASAFFWGLLIAMLYLNRELYTKTQLFRVSLLETSIFCLEFAAVAGSIAFVITQELLTLPSWLSSDYPGLSYGIVGGLGGLAISLISYLHNTLKRIAVESFMFGESVTEFRGLRTHSPGSERTYSNSFLDLHNFLHFQLLGHYLGNYWTGTNASDSEGDSFENYAFTCWRDSEGLEDEHLGTLLFMVSRNRLSDDEANNALIDVMRASTTFFATDDEYEERAESMTIEKFSHKDRDFGFSVEQNGSYDMRVLATVYDSKVVAIMARCSGNPASRIMDTFNEIQVRDWCSVGEAALASQRPLD